MLGGPKEDNYVNDEEEEERALESLKRKLKTGLDIRDRKWMLKSYPKCFVGSEMVIYLIKSKLVSTEKEAVTLGRLLVASNIIRHVTGDHDFKNEQLFYRFMDDEPNHGKVASKQDGRQFSWADEIEIKDSMNNINNSINNNSSHGNCESTSNINTSLKHRKSSSLNALMNEEEGLTVSLEPLDKYNQMLLDNVHPSRWINPKPLGRYNLIAIGAGAAGLISAASCSGIGGKAAIIEMNLFGGECLNYGCIPSKTMLKCARVIENSVIRGKEYGLNLKKGGYNVDFPRIMQRIRQVRAEISSHDACERFTKAYGLDVYLGKASFVSRNKVKVGKQILEFSRAVICTGAKPIIPKYLSKTDVPYLTNENIFNLTELPHKLGIIGCNSYAMEFAYAFSVFGSKVVIFHSGSKILPDRDRDAANIIKNKLLHLGVEFYLNCKIQKCDTNEDGSIVVTLLGHSLNKNNAKLQNNEDSDSDNDLDIKTDINNKSNNSGKHNVTNNIKRKLSSNNDDLNRKQKIQNMGIMAVKLKFDQLLVSMGVKPNVKELKLDRAGVKYDKKNGIEINDFLQTTNGDIYAAGDCCNNGKYNSTTVADAMAKIVTRNALFFGRHKQSSLLIPLCTYTSPEIAQIGSIESELKNAGIDYDLYKRNLNTNDRAVCDGNINGFIKILCTKNTDKIIGATIVCNDASNIITQITCCMNGMIGLSKLSYILHPYPTISEAIKHCADSFNRTRLTPTSRILMRKILSAKR